MVCYLKIFMTNLQVILMIDLICEERVSILELRTSFRFFLNHENTI